MNRDICILLDINLTRDQETSLGFLMTSTETTMILTVSVLREFLESQGYKIVVIDLEKENPHVGTIKSATIPGNRCRSSSNPKEFGKS
jgi:hypothetical protein